MSLAVVYTRAQAGVTAPLVACEVHLSGGLPGTSIVGLPETAVKEARDRVRAAILNAQLEYPQRRVTVNLAPADLPKDWCFHNYLGRFSNLWDDFSNLWDESGAKNHLMSVQPERLPWPKHGATAERPRRAATSNSSAPALAALHGRLRARGVLRMARHPFQDGPAKEIHFSRQIKGLEHW